MNNEKLVKQIDEFMALNRQCRQDGNDLLNKVRGVLTKSNSDEYERGLNDAWELARKICDEIINGGYTSTELRNIFGSASTSNVFHYTYQEALAKVEEYEKKKTGEAIKPVRGDVVKVTAKDNTHGYNGVYLGQNEHYIYILVDTRLLPVALYVFDYDIEKTGERVSFEYKKD